jgi:Mor family transcriptional regulator
MFEMFERPDLAEVSEPELQPLTAQMPPSWPETWREFATSLFVTLISAPGSEAAPGEALASLAMALTMGLAQDQGGTQPYIPVGAMLAASARARRAMEMRQRGASYKQAADATGLTENRIRKIEAEWHREQIALRQGRLQLD